MKRTVTKLSLLHFIFKGNAEEIVVPSLGASTYTYDDIKCYGEKKTLTTVGKTTYTRCILYSQKPV